MQQLRSEVVEVCACRKMREASRKVTRMYDDVLRAAGIKSTQFTLLAAATVQDKATLTELAESLGMDRTTLSRNLGPLARNGLVEVSAEGYRRARTVTVTGKGLAVMEEALPLWRAAQSSLRQQLGDDIWNRIQTELSAVRRLL